jgi:dihydropteroate synthase
MKLLFVTGRLAEHALRAVVADLAPRHGFEALVAVLPISVAALMTPRWVARHLDVPAGVDRVILPGHCRGDLALVEQKAGVPVELGPEDLRDLPRYLAGEDRTRPGYGAFDIEILAEINHAPRLTLRAILDQAEHFRSEGADVIDVGCDPGDRWTGIGPAVAALRDRGFRVSVDSFNPDEVADAVAAGAELVLSVNATNRAQAADWGAEVVAIPDEPHSLAGLGETSEFLASKGVPHRLDPVLDPIGFGFAASLGRYLDVRRLFPDRPVLMGVGNLTELTDVDSAGVNALLIGFCQEASIRSVLTTEVIPWARSSVREIDLARRLMHFAVTHHLPPKRLETGLIRLRDPKLQPHGPAVLGEIAARIKDPNWRLFAEDGLLHAMNNAGHLTDTDPFALFERMRVQVDDPSHAFYLGYELAKATTALTLGKNYRQDQALDWGHLTRPEISHRDRTPRKPGSDPG